MKLIASALVEYPSNQEIHSLQHVHLSGIEQNGKTYITIPIPKGENLGRKDKIDYYIHM